jgi:hypothetical protein
MFDIEDARGNLNGNWTIQELFHLKHRGAERRGIVALPA